jgi:integrase
VLLFGGRYGLFPIPNLSLPFSHLLTYPPFDDMVWTTEQGALLRRGSFGRIWRKAVAKSVGPPCRIHDLRHTHAAWLIADG